MVLCIVCAWGGGAATNRGGGTRPRWQVTGYANDFQGLGVCCQRTSFFSQIPTESEPFWMFCRYIWENFVKTNETVNSRRSYYGTHEILTTKTRNVQLNTSYTIKTITLIFTSQKYIISQQQQTNNTLNLI